jgi:kynurenine formamidase
LDWRLSYHAHFQKSPIKINKIVSGSAAFRAERLCLSVEPLSLERLRLIFVDCRRHSLKKVVHWPERQSLSARKAAKPQCESDSAFDVLTLVLDGFELPYLSTNFSAVQSGKQLEESSLANFEIIDLSQEIFAGMPVFPGLPEVKIDVHQTHEELEGITDSSVLSPAVNLLQLGEHTGTHVDALNHMAREYRSQSIDTMPLSMFYTEGICLDVSNKGLMELIEISDLERALSVAKFEINAGDTVLLYTDHYRRAFGTDNWHRGPGISVAAARWLGNQKIAAFGVEPASPGVRGVSNKEVHRICGELGFTHYENMINLHQLIGRGRFRFIGLPLRIRGGTGSPVRAIAVFEK